MQRRSFGSVRVSFLDKELAFVELTECAQRLMEEDERVLAVGLFGSLARGDALPSSDADILLVLRSHNLPRWFDRIPEYASKFHESTLPVEVFPYTHKELTSLMANPGFVRTAMDEIVLLAGDPMIFARLLDLNGNL